MKTRLKLSCIGLILLYVFLILSTAIGSYLVFGMLLPGSFNSKLILSLIPLLLFNASLFWVGIILVYLSSVQLGLKLRVLGVIFGMIPVLNLYFLIRIIVTVQKEVIFERTKDNINHLRALDKICATQYPILLVHGVFFRDCKYLNYWGRIPEELERNGALIFYGEQNSAASVVNSGRELSERIRDICINQGYEKVNIIAHSKGGLDTRAAISLFGCEDYVATLTTINTPHRGCLFADYLLNHIPESVQKQIAATYDAALTKLGDTNPSFMDAVWDLTAAKCSEFNNKVLDSLKVSYRSVGSAVRKASGGSFPLNYTTHLVKVFDGVNDGLVGEDSFPWGSRYQFLNPLKKRGISHGDVIDMTRGNLPGFDVREFYVQMVADLKKEGY